MQVAIRACEKERGLALTADAFSLECMFQLLE